ncbi:MAG: alpha/beta hydrolase fold domain-containing protein [Marvinbryantia sp.]
MKKTIQIQEREPQYIVSTGVAFAQVDAWFGHNVQNLYMDIVYTEGQSKRPCIIWICGGAWQQMNRSAHLVYLCELARQGFVVASVQYRTSNEVRFPAQLEDIKAAVRYLRAHANRYGIDCEKFGVMGESAGGHLTALTALTGEKKEFDVGDYLEYSSAVQAAIPWYVPADFETFPHDAATSAAAPESLLIGADTLTHKSLAEMASPVKYVTKDAPPMMLLHGTDDHTVPFTQGEELHDALEKAGAEVTLVAVEGADHADIHFFQKELWDMIAVFFKEKLA